MFIFKHVHIQICVSIVNFEKVTLTNKHRKNREIFRNFSVKKLYD